jgi:Glycosyltransferase like family 2
VVGFEQTKDLRSDPMNILGRDDNLNRAEEVATKSQLMWIVVLLAWLFITSTWLPSVLEGLLKGPTLYALALIPVCAWIQLATLLGIYQAASAIFGTKLAKERCAPRRAFPYPVAVLYTTMNDFRESAAVSCVSLDYPEFHVFLLDDSTSPRHRLLVDKFHSRFPEKTTVIRRTAREGFKAGNLNHALNAVHASFQFFAIADADTILPGHFLDATMRYFRTPNIGFVQARVEIKQERRPFVKHLSTGQDLYWRRIVPASARYGFMMLHGHGAIVRTSVWREVGGFPPLVAEDLAFSTRAREHGYLGVFAFDVVCEDRLPRNFPCFAARQLKYVRGAAEHIRTDAIRFLRSSRVPWFEKLDRMVGNLCLVSAAPFLASIVFLEIAQLVYPNSHLLARNSRLLIPDIAAVLFPLVPSLIELWKSPWKLVTHICCSVCVHLSMTFAACADAMKVILTRRTFFAVTGDIRAVRETATGASYWQLGLLIVMIGVGRRKVNMTEVILLSSVIALAVGNRRGWQHLAARSLRCVPMILILCALLLGQPFEYCIASSLVLAGTYSISL